MCLYLVSCWRGALGSIALQPINLTTFKLQISCCQKTNPTSTCISFCHYVFERAWSLDLRIWEPQPLKHHGATGVLLKSWGPHLLQERTYATRAIFRTLQIVPSCHSRWEIMEQVGKIWRARKTWKKWKPQPDDLNHSIYDSKHSFWDSKSSICQPDD